MEVFMNDPSIRKFREWRCYLWSREYPRAWYFTAYQSWYLTACCGLEVRKPTQAFKSVKDPGNIFDWIPKWARTLPSLKHFSWDIDRDPPPSKKKYQCWYMTPCCGLECRNPPRHLSQLKAREIPLIETPSGQELCRP